MQLTFIPADGFGELKLTAKVPIADLLKDAPAAESATAVAAVGKPRLRCVERNQAEMRCASLALWLFATSDGVGSARELDLLCEEHLADQWLCGGTTMDDRTLSDFRKDYVTFLVRLRTDGIATRLNQGPIEPRRVAQDGIRYGPVRVTICEPIEEEEKQKEKGIDPYQPKKRDGPGAAAWRQRMGTDEAKILYRQRASTVAWTNANVRSGFYQVRVRGRQKVLAVASFYALVHNLLRAWVLRKANKEATTG